MQSIPAKDQQSSKDSKLDVKRPHDDVQKIFESRKQNVLPTRLDQKELDYPFIARLQPEEETKKEESPGL